MEGIYQGDCLDVLRGLAANSVDAIVTDPPAGIAFMGKDWDAFRRRHNPNDVGRDNVFGRVSRTSPHSYGESERGYFIETMTAIFTEALRVLKPGGHALVWALPRTSHWTAMALEDAGFEIRDRVAHLFGQGFPKSLDISKAIDRAAGAERAVVGKHPNPGSTRLRLAMGDGWQPSPDITAPATDAAREWDGWGTALKPAVEDWWLVRKPISERTVAANVLRWGVGALNIDQCRIQSEVSPKPWATPRGGIWHTDSGATAALIDNTAGRWPANLVLDEEAAALLDAQSGVTKSRASARDMRRGSDEHPTRFIPAIKSGVHFEDTGGASRFFYVAKASRAERNAGCEALPLRTAAELTGRKEGSAGLKNPRASTTGSARTNTHPTVKPIALMRYLIRLITPPGGTVLDCFAGSGTTVVAAIEEGMRYVAIEREAEYLAIIEARAQHALGATEKPVSAVIRRKVATRTQKPATVATIAQVALWESEGAA